MEILEYCADLLDINRSSPTRCFKKLQYHQAFASVSRQDRVRNNRQVIVYVPKAEKLRTCLLNSTDVTISAVKCRKRRGQISVQKKKPEVSNMTVYKKGRGRAGATRDYRSWAARDS